MNIGEADGRFDDIAPEWHISDWCYKYKYRGSKERIIRFNQGLVTTREIQESLIGTTPAMYKHERDHLHVRNRRARLVPPLALVDKHRRG